MAFEQGQIVLYMKIAQIVCVYPPYKGGIGTSAVNAGRLLSEAGFDVTTFTPDYGQEVEPIKGVVRIKSPLKVGNAAFLPSLVKELKDFDVIYLHYPFFGAEEVLWFLKKFIWKNKKKLVVQYHMDAAFNGFVGKTFLKTHDLIFKSIFSDADLILSASLDYVRSSRIKKFYLENKEKFLEIPYGLDTNKFSPPQNKIANEKFKILFVGGLDKAHYFKGISVLLEALAELKKENQEFVLDIVGSGDLAPSYQQQAKDFGIAQEVIFCGKVSDEDLPDKYREADLSVLPSINSGEAFGIVLTESLACGVPVVASDLPGVRSVFNDGQEGFWSKTGDAFDLAAKIRFFMDYGVRRREMGLAARQLALDKYSFEVIGRKLKEAFNSLKIK
jgi:glycosyltransferase involved in cell wall biosynthesis